MKKLIGLFIFCLTAGVIAQINNSAINGMHFEIVNVEGMPLTPPPGEIAKHQKNSYTKAADGFSTIENDAEKVKNFFLHVKNAADSLKDQKKNKTRKDITDLEILFKASHHAKRNAIAAIPIGTSINDKWTGAEQIFKLDAAGTVRLTEYDLSASQGKFFMLKDSINTQINGNPAISKIFIDENGQSIEEVVWMTGSIFHMLTYASDTVYGGTGVRTKIAGQISAHSIAQELQ